MKKTKLTRSLLAACSIVALSAVMYGCTGDGSKNDLVATQEALDQEREAHAATMAEVTGLEGEVTTLSTALGAEMDPDPDSARGMLAAATARIGAADDPGSLLGMLDAEQKEAMRLSTLVGDLETELGDPTTPDPDSVRGMLNTANGLLDAANTRIGSVDDPLSLLGMLDAEQKKAEMYRVAIEGDGTDANPGLQAELDAANERIKTLLAGEDPDQLAPIAGGAGEVATDARTSATDADTDADAAEAADDNRATIQTGDANSVDHAENARMYATTADAEATKAEEAADKVAAATNADDADMYKDAAEAAKKAADDAAAMAKSEHDEAVKDAALELKIADTVKSVGGTSIDADAASRVATTDGNRVHTGLQDNDTHPMETVNDNPMGADAVLAMPNATPDPIAYSGPTAGVGQRTLTLGKMVDSADDMARLMIVTQYAGSNTVKVYASLAGDNQMGTRSGYISINDNDPLTGIALDPSNPTLLTDVNNVRLRSAGAYYLAETAGTLSSAALIMDPEDAEPDRVYYYVTAGPDTELGTDDDVRNYLVLKSESAVTTGGDTTTTYTYSDAAIRIAAIDHDGVGTTDDITPEVTAKIPEATDYEHIHFGVWADLGNADEDGSQEIDGLGIGFVQNYSGGGMTGADMPNNGEATYNGNWVATVQEADDDGNGDILLDHGDATIEADFGEGDITATLEELATLTGSIAGNSFHGTEASDITHGDLAVDGDFEGSFSGGFYGAKGAEAGGVFDFASDDDEDGAFRGAFGGKRSKQD